jgi:hypothetical protein
LHLPLILPLLDWWFIYNKDWQGFHTNVLKNYQFIKRAVPHMLLSRLMACKSAHQKQQESSFSAKKLHMHQELPPFLLKHMVIIAKMISIMCYHNSTGLYIWSILPLPGSHPAVTRILNACIVHSLCSMRFITAIAKLDSYKLECLYKEDHG